jgi:hypothetical protein
MVSVDKEYEFVSEQIRFHVDKVYESFKLFIQLFSAIVGGSIWLSAQGSPKVTTYIYLSDFLVFLIAAPSIIMIVEHWRAWRGYRHAQNRLGGKDENGKELIPLPSPILSWSSATEFAMIGTMIIGTCLFWVWNPFGN